MKQQIELLKCKFGKETLYVDFADKKNPVREFMPKENRESTIEVLQSENDTPPYFVIYVTDLCNMDCEYCFNKLGDYPRFNSKPIYSFDELIYFFISLNSQDIYIRFFGGEPLLNKDWIKDCVGRLNQLDIKFHYNIFTNSTLLDGNFIDFAIQNEFQFFCSLGGGEEKYKGIIYKDAIIKNITDLSKKTQNIIGSVVWSPDEELSIVDTLTQYRETGIKFITFILTWGGQYNQNNRENLLQQLYNFARFYVDLFLKHETWHLFVHPFIDYIMALLNKKSGHLDACAAGKTMAAISTDGKIYPCHCFSSHKKFESGNIRDLSWNKRFSEIDVDSISSCSVCEIKYMCKGRCYFNNYIQKGDILQPNNDRCILEKDIIACSSYIIKELSQHEKEYAVFKKIINMELKENVEH